MIVARVGRWRCRNSACDRRIFVERLPKLAARFGRYTTRMAEIVRVFGHSAGGRRSERLISRLAMPVSDTTILRSVKGTNQTRAASGGRIARSAFTSAAWFMKHPEVEIISRDRAGVYADAARQGAPQARQVADRFHVLKNFRDTIERQLGRFEAPIREASVPIESTDEVGTTALESSGCRDEGV